MCGILGGTIEPSLLKSLSQELHHRGPNENGVFQDEWMTLCHNRLSILDLSSNAHQPMHFQSLCMVYNGEIYNYKEVRIQLEKNGYIFQSTGDTEVLLKAFHAYGMECVHLLNGDFAFVIYDKKHNKVYACRDRLGNKPFYYYFKNNNFIFSSELPPIRDYLKPPLHLETCITSLLFNITDHGAATYLQDIYHLPPAHWLIYDLQQQTLKTQSYWRPSYCDHDELFDQQKCDQHIEHIDHLLEDSVKLRLRSDVPVGALISGGIDSSLIYYYIHKHTPDLLCYHVNYPEYPNISELAYINHLTDLFQKPVQIIEPSFEQLQIELQHLIDRQADLFRSLSIYSQYKAFQHASASVRVMISGQGADESFGGYYHHIARFLNHFPDQGPLFQSHVDPQSYIKCMALAKMLRLPHQQLIDQLKEEHEAYTKIIQQTFGDIEIPWQTLIQKFTPSIKKALWQDTTQLNLPQLLRYEDRNAMTFSIENRTPFTDYRLVEYIHSLPACYLFHDGWNKYPLRILASRHLSDQIAWRPNKLGFEAPDQHWIQKITGSSDHLIDFRFYLLKEFYGKHSLF